MGLYINDANASTSAATGGNSIEKARAVFYLSWSNGQSRCCIDAFNNSSVGFLVIAAAIVVFVSTSLREDQKSSFRIVC